ncbi:ATP-dependent Clp protease adaptor protein ClpS-domain-containing protein [Scenedesmus sp. NREL 46B-D3]|nr:ATP-dependent Clp protease adaptor protein ClpS-domain-containing protein [Scenedesmus sp. NREL 46B-D3]
MLLQSASSGVSSACNSIRGRARVTPIPRAHFPVTRLVQPAGSRKQLYVVAAGKGGLLETPTITTPTYEKGTESSKKKPPIYKVMLHNDNYNRREYVVKCLMKTVEGLTMDDAVFVMQEAHETGVAMVVACAQDKAETYVETMRLNGLIASMEPGH